MSEGLEELKRLAYENACCRCQYYIDKKCTNKHECIWLDIEKELRDGEKSKQVLEIIKNKPFNTNWFVFYKDYEEYCLEYEYVNESKRLTVEEWDLLKEMLL